MLDFLGILFRVMVVIAAVMIILWIFGGGLA
jgi:hypothetical protein